MDDQGGWLWALIDVGFVILLAIALVYGITTWRRRRNPTLERVRDAATRRAYEVPDETTETGGEERDRSAVNTERRRSAR
ncbi:MAG TPA: hypothetical protein VHA77_07780 [Xanthobacteraceae bacterium]|jgi:hypothetical protein|nr:hypothetical protein [Xanthobacteraceae bacterium]